MVDYPGLLLANGADRGRGTRPLRQIETWLSLVRRAHGITDGHVGRLWAQILAGTRGGLRMVSKGGGRTAADTAWERLLALRAAFEKLDLLPGRPWALRTIFRAVRYLEVETDQQAGKSQRWRKFTRKMVTASITMKIIPLGYLSPKSGPGVWFSFNEDRNWATIPRRFLLLSNGCRSPCIHL